MKRFICLVLPWVQNYFGPSKWFWSSTNHFGRSHPFCLGLNIFGQVWIINLVKKSNIGTWPKWFRSSQRNSDPTKTIFTCPKQFGWSNIILDLSKDKAWRIMYVIIQCWMWSTVKADRGNFATAKLVKRKWHFFLFLLKKS